MLKNSGSAIYIEAGDLPREGREIQRSITRFLVTEMGATNLNFNADGSMGMPCRQSLGDKGFYDAVDFFYGNTNLGSYGAIAGFATSGGLRVEVTSSNPRVAEGVLGKIIEGCLSGIPREKIAHPFDVSANM